MYSTIEETGVPYEISAKRSWDYSSDDKFTMGAQLGVQLDYRKLFFTLDYRHSFIRSQLNCNGFENTLQLGIQDASNINVSDLDDYDINSVIGDLRQGNKIVFMGGYARYYHVGFVFRKYVDGHAWVVDGYIDQVKNNQQSYYLHCNWGWGGTKNGYFLHNVFNAEQNPPYDDNAQTRGNNYQYNLETAIFTKQ